MFSREFFLLWFLFVLGLVIFIFFLSHHQKKKRQEGVSLFATTNGFNYFPPGPPGLGAYSFDLFHRGDRRGFENGVTGEWKGMPFKGADYWFLTESTDSSGSSRRHYERFSVVAIDIPAYLPTIAIDRENLLSAVAGKLGFGDIDFESEEFNRTFKVKAEDRRFAFELIDARMMSWLLSIDRRVAFQLKGKGALVYSRRLHPADLLLLIGTAKELTERIPRLVWKSYGTTAEASP